MAREKKKKLGRDGGIALDGDGAFSVPIGEALGLTDRTGETPQHERPHTETSAANASQDAETWLAEVKQATLHRETSGRGGRTVTVVSFKPAPDAALAELLARTMRKGLGCGSHAQDGKVVLQGDIQDRAENWLTRRGVKKIVMGN